MALQQALIVLIIRYAYLEDKCFFHCIPLSFHVPLSFQAPLSFWAERRIYVCQVRFFAPLRMTMQRPGSLASPCY